LLGGMCVQPATRHSSSSSRLVCVYTLKNVGYPEYAFSTDAGVMCLDFHPTHAALLAVGCYDGSVRVFDVRRRENKHVFASDIKSGKHNDPVWDVRWAAHEGGASASKDLSFYSISSDGSVATWVVTKSELKMEVLMTLKLTAAADSTKKPVLDPSVGLSETGVGGTVAFPSPAAAGGAGAAGAGGVTTSAAAAVAGMAAEEESRLTGLAGGCCFAFSPFQEGVFLVGTEEGRIHKCSVDYSGQYLATYDGHHMAVYSVRWNSYHPRVFLSASAGETQSRTPLPPRRCQPGNLFCHGGRRAACRIPAFRLPPQPRSAPPFPPSPHPTPTLQTGPCACGTRLTRSPS